MIPIILACFLGSLSLEEKIGQTLIVHFEGEVANEEAKTLICDAHVGGFIYYNWANGLHSFEQVKALSKSLQDLASIPLFIAIDQEGGAVARLSQGFTVFPGNAALGQIQDADLTQTCARYMGKELLAAGVNLNLAPVVDINNNPNNPIIGIRSFSHDPNIVATLGEKALLGYKQAPIIACLKHFPGHGDVQVDSHQDLPVIDKPLSELKQVELVPFAKLAPYADMIMTAHLLVPAFDPVYCSTLSKKTLSYLTDTMGFQGVIISDSLMMDGVMKQCPSIEEVAIQAFNAGCDILLLGGKQLSGASVGFELKPGDIKQIHKALVRAVQEGRISLARVDEAVEKILRLKDRYLRFQEIPSIDIKSHKALSQKIASLALKTQINTPISLKGKKIALFAPEILRSSLAKIAEKKYFFSQLNPSKEEKKAAQVLAQTADVLVIYSYNSWKNPLQIAFIQSLLHVKKQTVLVITRDPQDAVFFPNANTIFTTYSPTEPSLEAAYSSL